MSETTDWAAFWLKHPTPWRVGSQAIGLGSYLLEITDANRRPVVIQQVSGKPEDSEISTFISICQLANQYTVASRLAKTGDIVMKSMVGHTYSEYQIVALANFSAALAEWKEIVNAE